MVSDKININYKALDGLTIFEALSVSAVISVLFALLFILSGMVLKIGEITVFISKLRRRFSR